ncbi:hypothetical protein [Beihai sea slater virus 4]|uniref:hypothetical protein n=1 Tax=Beihai sea slater virus 4 TaxID=1922660 RepID=UPI00090A1EE4|nr:hypothetical protein [Beihai sea slater virus 4]APG77556.1 hypothetical protein [Beihai sea slater virus 4]
MNWTSRDAFSSRGNPRCVKYPVSSVVVLVILPLLVLGIKPSSAIFTQNLSQPFLNVLNHPTNVSALFEQIAGSKSTMRTIQSDLNTIIRLLDSMVGLQSARVISMNALLVQINLFYADLKYQLHALKQINVELNLWVPTMRDLKPYMAHGDHEIVLDGMPHTRLRGHFHAKHLSLNCMGLTHTFCSANAHGAYFDVSDVRGHIKPLRGV